ncbi:MAG TPA: POTRA domain-containing protein, partial [Sphingomicrobium sp.]|nr:POTRA domain-containing protein [Sphingomicrobium sp.]
MPDIGVDWPELGSEPAESAPLAASPAVPGENAERQYSVAINGLHRLGNAAGLVEAFEQQSALFENRDEEANAAQIQRRSEADAELLAELLRSQGYYDAQVVPRVDAEGHALLVTLEAEPGEQYRFQSVVLAGIERAGAEAGRLREAFGVKAGDAVVAQDVAAANVNLKVALGEQGFALATVGEQEIIVDHQTRLATLVLPVNPGPVATFGSIRVSGNPPFDARHVTAIARFKRGDRFERDEVDDLRRALVATGLVSSAEVQILPAAGNRVDLNVSMQPAPPRTVAGQLGYGTGEGLRAEASWQHRNFIRPEGALTLRAIGGTREQLAGVSFRRNNFGGRDRVLNAQLVASKTEFAAYDAKTLLLAANIERQSNIIWRKKWTWSLGTELLATDERGIFTDPANEQTRTFLVGALPATLYYDGSDDLLNPTRGFRLGGRLSPEISARGGTFTYARAQVD